MNTPEQNVDKTVEHEGLIRTPKQLITVILLAFIVPIAVILLIIRLVTASTPLGVGSDAQSQEAVAKRIQPVAGFALVGAEGASEERTGEQVYASTCSACHTAGVAGAPKLGDAAAWEPLVAKGYEELLKNAIHGINAMPPRGGNPNLTDLEVARAVVHITNQSGGDFPEPTGEGADAAAGEVAAEGQAAAPADTGAQGQASTATAAAPAGDAAQARATALQAAQAQETAAEGAGAQAGGATQQAEPAQQEAAAAGGQAGGSGNIDLPAGEKLYKSVCFACHQVGVAGAPKLGDKAAWEPLIAAGMDQMIKIAIEGKGAMPPRGGSTASDEEVIAAVHYMVNAVK